VNQSRRECLMDKGSVYKKHDGRFDWMYVMPFSHLIDQAIGGLMYHHCIAYPRDASG
jgi:hypothetical protein